jgi:hypothetical protein
MRNIIKISSFFVFLAFFASCENGFQDANTDKEILPTVKPQELFPTAVKNAFSSSWSFYYEGRELLKALQYSVPMNGNSDDLGSNNANFSGRYGIFYNVGNLLSEMDHIVSTYTSAEQAKYSQMLAIAKIFKVYKAWYASDVCGSMPYTEAFKVRHGGTDKPKYDTQSALFATWETELAASIASLKANTTNQEAMGKSDLIFEGNASKWIKTANALRLRMAVRLLKKDAARATTIINAVLASPAADLMSSFDDDCVFVGGPDVTSHSDWTSINGYCASKPVIDFMNANADPRLPLMFRPNNYSQANIDIAIAANKLPAGTVEGNRYIGGTTSPKSVAGNPFFTKIKVNDGLLLDPLSHVQEALFNGVINNGTGRTSFPVITYAEFCFLKAELIVKGKATGDAKALYEAGITASIKMYEKMAKTAKVIGYTDVAPATITAYLTAPNVAFSSVAARQLEQIAEQSFLHFYKSDNEGWALYKRTGMPNTSTALKLEALKNVGGQDIVLYRKYITSTPSLSDWNYTNAQAAITEMKLDPKFTMDMSGKVWWDSAN